ATTQALLQQQQQVVARLKSEPPTGRLVVKISSAFEHWENTPSDIEVRAGDVLTIPKRPDFVLVSGQVYNPAALTYTPRKNAGWYLRRAGGATELANRKAIFVVRVDGSVVGARTNVGWWKGNLLSTVLQPGDTVVVPEKALGRSGFWKDLSGAAQFAFATALSARVIAGL
ncbi:MAG: sugar transporter, partial [Acidobacteriota bacterium]